MEAVEESPVQSATDSVKVNSVSDKEPAPVVKASHTSNGVSESTTTPTIVESYGEMMGTIDDAQVQHAIAPAPQTDEVCEAADTGDAAGTGDAAPPNDAASVPPEEELLTAIQTNTAVENLLSDIKSGEGITEEIVESTTDSLPCNEVTVEGSTLMVDTVDASNDKVTLRTEVLVEKSEDDIPDHNNEMGHNHDSTNNILSELGHGIEFSEALRSSDTTDHGENNNGIIREEVFNKEELLDILEGNDDNDDISVGNESEEISNTATKKMTESQMALNQLSKLKRQTSKRKQDPIKKSSVKTIDKLPKKRKSKKTETSVSENAKPIKDISNVEKRVNDDINEELETEEVTEDLNKKNDNIVNVLVKDWDDEETPDDDQSSKLIDESENLLKATDPLEQSQNSTTSTNKDNDISVASSVEAQITNQNKSNEESLPQRSRSRVIKKKVIFDPDNPDTFTKGKVVTKLKEPLSEKEQSPAKKTKAEQTPQRPKSKSPVSKLQWKKPTPKNSNKHNKRLTEVDKLLMDEGAVNMIYQLTPEALKGKKNMRTKAEFIKQIQSSNPDGKEMKFRERKKEIKSEEGEAKKIVSGKSSRSSVSGSVKSPSACEDFETHSADDSIIYRRHSSSSYSSTCMSPRRLSDVETGAAQMAAKAAALSDQNQAIEDNDKKADSFMADSSGTANETINKDDCLSLKEKLNTKLSLALKKRKRETNTKTDKPPKQKRVSKTISAEKDTPIKTENLDNYKHISVNFEQRLVEICIRKTGSGFSIEMLKELEQAMLFADSKNDTSVTFLTSECGTLCSELDLKPLMSDSMEVRTNYAHAIAEAVRSLLSIIRKHSKLLVSGVWGACSGVALVLVALSDVVLASESSTFAVNVAAPLPGITTLTASCSKLSQSLVNDLIVFGRSLSATEALQGGLVSRCMPGAGPGLVRAVARDIASQTLQSVILKKQLLNISKSSASETTFLSGLQKERDLLVEYWTSVEGQNTLRAMFNP